MIQVVQYDPAWSPGFDAEARRIAEGVGSVAVRLHHIGSTAIAQTCAKPIIDILLEATSLVALDHRAARFEALGYQGWASSGLPAAAITAWTMAVACGRTRCMRSRRGRPGWSAILRSATTCGHIQQPPRSTAS